MSKYLNHNELIGAYLEGSMSPDEMLEFENQLHTDPVLHSEFELQQDIVNSLKDFRKSQLKARLDQVPVSVSPTGIVGVKTAALIVLTGIIGVGTYLFLDNQKVVTPESANELVVESLEPEVLEEAVETLSSEDVKSTVEEQTLVSEEESDLTEPQSTQIADVSAKAENKAANNTAVAEIAAPQKEEEQAKVTAPVINSPQIIDPSLEDNGDETLEIPTPELGETEVSENPVLEVETTKESSNEFFHYQYYSGKLYLYGDFTDNPYEIIELNSASGKKLFMFYNGNYYRIFDNKVDLTPLQAVKDQDIIKELDIIKENK
jgi:hypothetical protein